MPEPETPTAPNEQGPPRTLLPAHAWIGFDLDGTLAYYEGWQGDSYLGDPVPRMLARLKAHLAAGHACRIVTARVGFQEDRNVPQVRRLIEDWTEKHCGVRLRVTCQKDYGMLYCYDDRVKQVVPNDGRLIEELSLVEFAMLRNPNPGVFCRLCGHTSYTPGLPCGYCNGNAWAMPIGG